MANLQIVTRSPDGVSYFAPESLTNFANATIDQLTVGAFNIGGFFEPDSLRIPIASVGGGFPQLYFRLSGQFNIANKLNSLDQSRAFALAGSVIDTIEVVDGSGTVYTRLSGISITLATDKTSFFNEPVNALLTSFSGLQTPLYEDLMSGADNLTGSNGGELLQGFGGDDTVSGLGGVDGLYGGAGRDRLIGGNDADDLYGGDGNDTIVGYTTGDFIDGGADFDSWALTGTFSTGIGLSPIIDLSSVTFFGIEAIRITWGEFLLNSNQVGGASTVQTIVAGSTDRDMLRVAMAPGATVMDLSAVNFIDWNNSGGEFDRLTLLGSAAGDTIKGSKVNEVIFAYDGANSVGGGDGDDRIVGGLQADTLRGGNGSDTLDGGGGNDILIGDEDFSADPKAGRGDDMLYGGDGDDLLFAVRGFNEIHGGTGNDTVDIGFVAQDPAEGRTPSSWSST